MRKILWGLFFVIMAVLLVAGQVMELNDTVSIILTLFFGAVLIESMFSKNLFFSLLSIAFMVIINKDYLNISELSNFSIIASSVLLSIGLSIIFSKKKKIDFHHEDVSYEESDIVNLNVSFGSSIKYVTSENFKKAFISCNFSGAQVYFDNANIVGDTAEIELDVSFSGVEIYIPKNWKVINNVNVTLGGIDEVNRSSDSTKTVVLTGKVSLSGVEIRYI